MTSSFQGFWHGPPLGPIQKSCLSTFIERGHDFELFTYEEIEVPQGVRINDAATIIPFDELFHFENPNTGKPDLGPFSDLFRFKLLMERGGWWSDVDTICLADDIPQFRQAWAREAPRHMPKAVGTSQLAMEKDGLVARTLYERCLQISRAGFRVREAIGPRLISSVISELGLPTDMNGTSATFFPVPWIEAFKLWLPEYSESVEAQAKGALFMPIYQSFPQVIGLDVGGGAPSGSYLADLCDRLSPSDAPRYDADDVRSRLRVYFGAHAWARDELCAYGGSGILADLLS